MAQFQNPWPNGGGGGPTFDPNTDAQTLFKAMKGAGTDEQQLINVLFHRPPGCAPVLRETFKKNHKQDLIKRLEQETSGNFEKLLVAAALGDLEFRATQIHKAIHRPGTNDRSLIQCVCTLMPHQALPLIDCYKKLFGDLKGDIKSDTSGWYEKTLLAVLEPHPGRQPGLVDPSRAGPTADAFYKAGAGKLGTDEKAYIKLLTSNSREQLQLVNKAYATVKGKGRDMEKDIVKETSGNLERALLALYHPLDVYYAMELKKATKGLGTDDGSLIRCIMLPDPWTLRAAIQAYERLYGKKKKADNIHDCKSLEKDIKGDTSGWYEKALLARIKYVKSLP